MPLFNPYRPLPVADPQLMQVEQAVKRAFDSIVSQVNNAPPRPLFMVVIPGKNGAGQITVSNPLTGVGDPRVRTGDEVLSVLNLTSSADDSGLFATEITAPSQVQQIATANLSASTFAVLIRGT